MDQDDEYFYGSDPMYQLVRAYEGARECWDLGVSVRFRLDISLGDTLTLCLPGTFHKSESEFPFAYSARDIPT